MSHHWNIRGSIPPTEEDHAKAKAKGYCNGAWATNIEAHVVAASAKRAIELVEQRHPRINVWNITHRGKLDIIEDAEGSAHEAA